MKTITIKVIVPDERSRWRVTIGSGQRKKKNAIGVFSFVERCLQRKFQLSLASHSNVKTKVVVDYSINNQESPMTTLNEGIYTEKNEVLYALASFLEDYLPKYYQNKKYKTYRKEVDL